MNLLEIDKTAVSPALAFLPAQMNSPEARVMLFAIGLQESQFVYRRQHGNGPARSFWQAEKGSRLLGGGVMGVVRHKASRYWLNALAEWRGVQFDNVAIWAAMENDDVLAAGFARLLLFTDARPLPKLHDLHSAWECYAKRTWCPGKPKPEKWPRNYGEALQYVLA